MCHKNLQAVNLDVIKRAYTQFIDNNKADGGVKQLFGDNEIDGSIQDTK